MAGRHLIVHLFNSPIKSCVPVFLIHVVITSSALIPKPDPVILYLCWVLFKNLIDGQNLPIALLHFLQLPQVIPELRFGTDLIGGPKLHAVDLGMLIRLRRQSSSHNLVLVIPESNHSHTRLEREAAADCCTTITNRQENHCSLSVSLALSSGALLGMVLV